MDSLNNYQFLSQACLTDDVKNFEKYIYQLPNLEYKNEKGWSVLIMAAFAHSYKIVEKLLEMGADINATNNKGTTVLMYAKTKVKENSNFAFLDFLIDKGADPSKKDIAGKNVLDYVRETNDEPLIKYFEKKLTDTTYGKK
jgi:ankyrin repeat protein